MKHFVQRMLESGTEESEGVYSRTNYESVGRVVKSASFKENGIWHTMVKDVLKPKLRKQSSIKLDVFLHIV